MGDLVFGDADDDEVTDGELGIADAVVDEGGGGVVGVPVVGLDDEAVGRPVEVSEVAPDRMVGDRRRHGAIAERLEERAFEDGAIGAVRAPASALGRCTNAFEALRIGSGRGEVAARVVARPCRVVISRVVTSWKMRSRRLRGARRPVTLSSTNGGIEGISLWSAVAVLWLSPAGGPATSSAAHSRPRTGIASWPTAQTPR